MVSHLGQKQVLVLHFFAYTSMPKPTLYYFVCLVCVSLIDERVTHIYSANNWEIGANLFFFVLGKCVIKIAWWNYCSLNLYGQWALRETRPYWIRNVYKGAIGAHKGTLSSSTVKALVMFECRVRGLKGSNFKELLAQWFLLAIIQKIYAALDLPGAKLVFPVSRNEHTWDITRPRTTLKASLLSSIF